ncbi:MFS transporter [Corynebacterium bovis]|nr:MFS transporter [Corynebacterium bovis]MDK8511730.1 MFS transporter [Corynebacterium bovis]
MGIAISMIVMSVALVFNNIIVLALAAALIGAGQGVSNLGSFGLIHERVDNSEVAAATSLLSLGTYASATVVPILGGVLLDVSGLEVAGLVMAAGVLVMCGVGIAVGSGPDSAETEG